MPVKLFKNSAAALFISGTILLSSLNSVQAQGTGEEEIASLKAQVQELTRRIEQLETAQAKTKDDARTAKEEAAKTKEELAKVSQATGGRVDLSNLASKLKIKGRAAAGFFDSGKAGSFPSGSWEVPDAKIQFSFQPDDINTFVMRFNLNNATAQNPLLDYLYLQSKDFLPLLKETPFSLSGKLGRFKLGFGEENISNNIVDGILPSNSAANTGVSDEALEFSGKIKLDKIKIANYAPTPLGWAVSVSDGNSGVGADNSAAKAFMGKLYYTPVDPLYLSASYYDSGSLKNQNAEMSVAGLVSSPLSTTGGDWKRKVWELDARYDFGKGKKPLDPQVFSDSKAILRLSYGEFHDISNIGRFGNFGFIDGIYNLTKKFYTAGRYSFLDLTGDTTASLNGVAANRYERYSLGLGYRFSQNTLFKLGYDWNKETGTNTQEADNNLLSAVVASQF